MLKIQDDFAFGSLKMHCGIHYLTYCTVFQALHACRKLAFLLWNSSMA